MKLLNPRDIYPCVEDPERLTYLDLEGCFGDICELSNSAYVKQVQKVDDFNYESALRSVLAERWAYDDLSDEELESEETANQNQEESQSTPTTVLDSSSNDTMTASLAISVTSKFVLEDDDPTADEESDDEDADEVASKAQAEVDEEDLVKTTSSQASFDVLVYETESVNVELVQYYMEIASKGERISLKSVDGITEEGLL